MRALKILLLGVTAALVFTYPWPASAAPSADFTAVYSAIGHDFAVPSVPMSPERQAREADALRAIAAQAHYPVTEAQIQAQVATAVADSMAPVDTRPVYRSILFSEHGGSVLIEQRWGQPGETGNQPLNMVTCFDGSTTFMQAWPPNGRLYIQPGFHPDNLIYVPPVAATIGPIQLIRPTKSVGQGTWRANAVYTEAGPCEYIPSAIVRFGPSGVAGPPEELDCLDSTGKPSALWQFTGSVRVVGGHLLPQRATVTVYDQSRGGLKLSTCTYTLTSASNSSVDSVLFDPHSYLHHNINVATTFHGKPILIQGYRTNQSLEDQEESTYLRQEAMAGGAEAKPGRGFLGSCLLVAIVAACVIMYFRARRA